MANSKRRCKHCREYVSEWLSVPAGVFCNLNHAMAWQENARQAAAQKAYKAKTADRKRKLLYNDRKYWLEKAQGSFNAWVRARDKGLPCISCGKPDNGDVRHASHFKSRGANSFLRYHPMNVNASCVKCNAYNSGALDGYALGIIEKYGIEALKYLNNAPRVRRYDISYLKRVDIVCRKLEKRAARRSTQWTI